MSADNSKRCPACWSTIQPRDTECPECGESLQRQGRGWFLPTALVVLVATSATVYWGVFHGNRPGPGGPGVAEDSKESDDPRQDFVQQPNPRTTDTDTDIPEPSRRQAAKDQAPPYHLRIRGEQGAVPMLRLQGRTPDALFCMPLRLLPTRGALTTMEDEDLDVAVVTVAWQHGLALLSVPATQAEAAAPVAAEPAAGLTTAQRLETRDARGRVVSGIALASPLGGGIELELTRSAPVGAALMHDDHAVAYAVGGRAALPLDPLLPWLRQSKTASSMTLTELQKQMRRRDPRLVLDDAGSLLASRPATMQKIGDAITMLERGQYQARDAATVKAFDDLLRQAHQQRVRVQSHTDPVQALILANKSLYRYPNHAGILSDAALLTASHGEPSQALELYRRLLGASTSHAKNVADDVVRGVLKAAQERRRSGRNQDAVTLLMSSVDLFPLRPDLRLAYAQALSQVGRSQDALAQASEAARLDPSYTRHLGRYQRGAAGRTGNRRSGKVVIPFDPKTRVINTRATVGSQAVRFVVDTGASLTTIPTAVADALRLRKKSNPRAKITTASGVVDAEVVVLPSLRLGSIRLRKVQAIVLDLPGDQGKTGLLGLNVLRALNMQIDSEKSQLILQRPRRRR